MIGIDTIVWFVFVAIIIVSVLGLLWWLIGYCERNITWVSPVAWKAVRVVFVVLVVFLLIAVLLGMLGHPLVRL